MAVALLALAVLFAGCGSASVQMGSGPEEVKSPLFSAIASGDLAAVQAEISRNPALVNQPEGSLIQTPLHMAVRSKQLEIAQFLIENGADVNMFDNLQRTPLAAAIDAEAGPEIVQLLESYGAVD